MIKFSVIILVLFSSFAFAEDLQKAYDDGIKFSGKLRANSTENLDFLDAKVVREDDLPQSNEAYELIKNLHNVKPNTEGIENGSIASDFERINDIAAQENFVKDQNINTRIVESKDVTNHVCTEVTKPEEIKCSEKLLFDVVYVPEVKEVQSEWVCNLYKKGCQENYGDWKTAEFTGFHGSRNASCPNVCRDYNNVTVVKEQDKIIVDNEQWIGGCKSIEQHSYKVCKPIEEVCVGGQQTNYFHGFPITRCFEREKTFNCMSTSQGTCKQFKQNENCQLVQSKCIDDKDGNCQIWEQHYSCRDKFKVISEKVRELKGKMFCLDGSCADHGNETNNDFNKAIAELSIFGDLGMSQQEDRNISIFGGSNDKCHYTFIGINNCCKQGNGGWGNNIIDQCNVQEKSLNEKKKQGLCTEIGAYCSDRVLGKCVKRTRAYCCFNNQISRIIHEQGRPQLGMNFGSPDAPVCRGFTVEEIQRIDLSKINLSEVFEKISSKVSSEKLAAMRNKLNLKLENLKGELNVR